MIKLTRRDEPKILADNSAKWTTNLIAAVTQYSSYGNVPKLLKDALLQGYHHTDIKNELSISSHGKCAFCECILTEGGYLQVEHFAPKSIFPSLAFKWENLLPACVVCNTRKSSHDTVAEPIVNPYENDPRDYFDFFSLSIKPIAGPNYDVAKKTIEVCALDGIHMLKPRADILVSLHQFEKAISEAIDEWKESDTDRKRNARFRKLQEAISTIDSLRLENGKYSAFCSAFLLKSDSYVAAKKIINYSA